jgi:hypothetical protein
MSLKSLMFRKKRLKINYQRKTVENWNEITETFLERFMIFFMLFREFPEYETYLFCGAGPRLAEFGFGWSLSCSLSLESNNWNFKNDRYLTAKIQIQKLTQQGLDLLRCKRSVLDDSFVDAQNLIAERKCATSVSNLQDF